MASAAERFPLQKIQASSTGAASLVMPQESSQPANTPAPMSASPSGEIKAEASTAAPEAPTRRKPDEWVDGPLDDSVASNHSNYARAGLTQAAQWWRSITAQRQHMASTANKDFISFMAPGSAVPLSVGTPPPSPPGSPRTSTQATHNPSSAVARISTGQQSRMIIEEAEASELEARQQRNNRRCSVSV